MRIFITRQIPDAGIKLLEAKKYTIEIYHEDKIIPRKELLRGVRGADAILSLLTDAEDAHPKPLQLQHVAHRSGHASVEPIECPHRDRAHLSLSRVGHHPFEFGPLLCRGADRLAVDHRLEPAGLRQRLI